MVSAPAWPQWNGMSKQAERIVHITLGLVSVVALVVATVGIVGTLLGWWEAKCWFPWDRS